MPGKLVVISGTGTEIGKTHVAEALLLAWKAAGVSAAGIKPVESGVTEELPSDSARLASASLFHVKPIHSLRTPLAPYAAARLEGVEIDPRAVTHSIAEARSAAAILLLELPGGLFSPFTATTLNADFVALLRPDTLLLVAPDRLGVLHDTISTVRAAGGIPLDITGVILNAPARPDLSTATNAAELRGRIPAPVLATLPRGSPAELAVILSDVARLLAP